MSALFAEENKTTTLLALGIALVAYILGGLTGDYSTAWYSNLVRPWLLPSWLENSIGLIWAVIFLCAGLALALVLAERRNEAAGWKRTIIVLLLVNLALNYWYSYRFTINQDLAGAFWIACAVVVSVLALIGIMLIRAPLAALALAPYLALGIICNLHHLPA